MTNQRMNRVLRLKRTFKTQVAEEGITRPALRNAISIYNRRFGTSLYCNWAHWAKYDHIVHLSDTETGCYIARVTGNFKGNKHITWADMSARNVQHDILKDQQERGFKLYVAAFSTHFIYGRGEESKEHIALWALKGKFSPAFKAQAAVGSPEYHTIKGRQLDRQHEWNREWVKLVQTKTSFTLTADSEYNDIIGKAADNFDDKIYLLPRKNTGEPVALIPNLVRTLEVNLNKMEISASTTDVRPTLGRSMGKSKIGSAVLTADNRVAVMEHKFKNHYSVEHWSALYKKRNLPVAFLMFKPGTSTSSGAVRNLFPLQPELEGHIRQLYSTASLHILKDYCRDIRTIPSRYKYGYDIISCDKTSLPYIRDYYIRNKPDRLNLILPKLIVDKNIVIDAYDQFPSGSPLTSIISNTFTQSLIDSIGVDAKFNGDGILSTEPIEHPYLRQTGLRNINNFNLGPEITYLRYDKIDSATYYRGGNKAHGKLRYLLRHRGISDFCRSHSIWARCLIDTRYDGIDFKNSPIKTIFNYLAARNIDVPKILRRLTEFENSCDEHCTYAEDQFVILETSL